MNNKIGHSKNIYLGSPEVYGNKYMRFYSDEEIEFMSKNSKTVSDFIDDFYHTPKELNPWKLFRYNIMKKIEFNIEISQIIENELSTNEDLKQLFDMNFKI